MIVCASSHKNQSDRALGQLISTSKWSQVGAKLGQVGRSWGQIGTSCGQVGLSWIKSSQPGGQKIEKGQHGDKKAENRANNAQNEMKDRHGGGLREPLGTMKGGLGSLQRYTSEI